MTGYGDSEYDDWTMIEIRREIIERVGSQDSPVSPMTKTTLNSLAAYLTGSLPTDPTDLHSPDNPSRVFHTRQEIREILIEEVDALEYSDTREFRKPELVEILTEMDERGDRREFSGDEFGELSP